MERMRLVAEWFGTFLMLVIFLSPLWIQVLIEIGKRL